MSGKKLFLLDGHALVYRAHYAFINRPLRNSKGLNTSAVMGFTRALLDIKNKQEPSHLAVSFDLSGPTFRNEMYTEYKANREAQPEDITIAIPYIQKIIEGYNIPIITAEGYEADDVIGTLAKQAEKEGFQVYMVTPDKDYAQLVSPNIFMYKPARSGNDAEILGEKEVLEKWNIQRVDQVIDILGLQGDAVDNIPGIPGIGPKTAQKLLASYDSLEGIIAHSGELKGKQKERVEAFAEQGILSKKLATIDTEVPVTFNAKEFELSPPDKKVLAGLYKELEFRSLYNQMADEPSTTSSGQTDLFGQTVAVKSKPSGSMGNENSFASFDATKVDYQKIEGKEAMESLAAKLSKLPMFCFDTETSELDPHKADMVGIAFSWEKGKGYYVPTLESDQRQLASSVFKKVLEDERIQKIAHNFKYDALILKYLGIEIQGGILDTMIAHYLIAPELRHKMDYLAEAYLEYKPIPIESLIGKGKHQLSMRQVALDKVVDYAIEDADITARLQQILFEKLNEDGLAELYHKMEEPLIRVLTQIEYNGVKIDSSYLNAYSLELEASIRKLEEEIYQDCGQRFNIGSPKQVGEILFDVLKLPYRWKKTASGQYSTSEDKLTEMAADYEFVSKILKFRGLSKLKSTYVDALPRMVNSKTGFIHSSFNQALTATGRLSSNNPNLQNIPIRTEEGARVRKAFIPRGEDYVLLAADYSQIELRLIAELSGEQSMLEAFIQGQDIHTATAAKVFDTNYEEVTKEQRYKAKTVNFSIIYGSGASNLAKQLDIKRSEAKALIDSYFEQYAGLKSYMEHCVAEAREKGYVSTMMGRRRYLKDINSKNGMLRSHAERNAVNTPVQGTAADMIKLAMISIHKILEEGGYQTKMILQVHDELVFDVHKDELEELKPKIEEAMKQAIPGLTVPILVGMDTGANWLEAH